LSPDYIFLISKGLLNQKLIKKVANNVFILTAIGRSLLECSKDGLKRKKTITLIEVSRSFGNEVESPSFKPEISFINPETISSGCCRASKEFEHNLNRGLITEVVSAQSIQKSIKRLTFVNRKRPARNV